MAKNNIEFEVANASYDLAQDRMKLLPNYYQWMHSVIGDYIKGRVVELGAGSGHLIPNYINQVESVLALDFNPKLVEGLRRRFSVKKFDAIQADLLGDFSEIRGDFDTALAMDVLEHFENDRELVKKIAAILPPGGVLICKIPAGSKLYGETDKSSGHYRRYDLQDLETLMKAAGLTKEVILAFNKPGAFMYRMRRNKKSNFSRTFKPSILRMINFLIPFLTLFDKILPGPGLSWIGVFRK